MRVGKAIQRALGIFILVLSAGSVRANITPGRPHTIAFAAQLLPPPPVGRDTARPEDVKGPRRASIPSQQALRTPPARSGVSLPGRPCPYWPASSLFQGHSSDKTFVMHVPAPPGSASLVFSGLLSLTALRLARNAWNVRLYHLPEWCHSATPAQIGHAVSFDLDGSSLPLCPFEQPEAGRQPAVRRPRAGLPTRQLISQCVLTLTAPRGPPTGIETTALPLFQR
jgi:hypothetical protein